MIENNIDTSVPVFIYGIAPGYVSGVNSSSSSAAVTGGRVTVSLNGFSKVYFLPTASPVPVVGTSYTVGSQCALVIDVVTSGFYSFFPSWSPAAGPFNNGTCSGVSSGPVSGNEGSIIYVQNIVGNGYDAYFVPTSSTPPVLNKYYRINKNGAQYCAKVLSISSAIAAFAPFWAPLAGPFDQNSCGQMAPMVSSSSSSSSILGSKVWAYSLIENVYITYFVPNG